MATDDPSWVEIFQAAWDSYRRFTERLNEAVPAIQERLRNWTDQAVPVLQGLGNLALQFQAAYNEGTPDTWRAIDPLEMVEVARLMGRTGWCLTMAPSSAALKAMVAAPTDDLRAAILVADEAAVLDALDRELRAIDVSLLPMTGHAARVALDAHTSGLFMASQALATNALTALLEPGGPFSFKSMASAREFLRRLDFEEARMREIRFYAVAGAVAYVFRSTDPHSRQPRFFHRHSSAHYVDSAQYSQLNSLTAVMLLVGFLYEALWLVRGLADETDGA